MKNKLVDALQKKSFSIDDIVKFFDKYDFQKYVDIDKYAADELRYWIVYEKYYERG